MGKEIKTTLRFDTDNEQDMKIYGCIARRDKRKYRSISEYVSAAINVFESIGADAVLTEKDLELIEERMRKVFRNNGNLPGI